MIPLGTGPGINGTSRSDPIQPSFQYVRPLQLFGDVLPLQKPSVGFEPTTTGLQIRCSKNTSSQNTSTCKNEDGPLTPQWTPETQKQDKIYTSELPPDMAEIIAVWPELPEHIKTAIKALIQAHKGTER